MTVSYQVKGYRVEHRPDYTRRTPYHLIGPNGLVKCFRTKREANSAIPMIEYVNINDFGKDQIPNIP